MVRNFLIIILAIMSAVLLCVGSMKAIETGLSNFTSSDYLLLSMTMLMLIAILKERNG